MFLLLPLGRIEEALGELRLAGRADPLSPAVRSTLQVALRASGRFDELQADCEKNAGQQAGEHCRAASLLRGGNAAAAVPILEARWSSHLAEPGASELGVAYAYAGRREDAERIAAATPRPIPRAMIFAALGDKDRAFETLEQAVPLGPVRIGRDALISPTFAPLKGDPRLKLLRRKVGLPE